MEIDTIERLPRNGRAEGTRDDIRFGFWPAGVGHLELDFSVPTAPEIPR